MTIKQFQVVKIIAAITVGGIVGYSVTVNNYIAPAIIVAAAAVTLFYLRSRVKGILADERDYEIGGHAARWSIQIFSWIATIAMFVLYAERALNPIFEIVAFVLAYSVCTLLILYSVLYKYHDRIRFAKNKTYYIIFGLILLAGFTLVGIRLFSGEDSWICSNGEWVEHGHPSAAMPTTLCQ
ncbi:MAG: DUF2178 domain-containing protein [Patescibacteria group bacterium]|jgi:uncharacterized membrane protein